MPKTQSIWQRARAAIFKPTETPSMGEKVSTGTQDPWRVDLYGQGNPDPLLLDKGQTLELYDDMMQDDVIAGTLDIQKRITLSSDWYIKPAPGENKTDAEKKRDEEVAEFVQAALEDDELEIPFVDVLDNFLDAKPYGFKIAEKLWHARDGKVWLYKAIKCKPSYEVRFYTDEFGNLKYVYRDDGLSGTQEPAQALRYPLDRLAIFVWPYVKDGNWYGRSVLSALYREWYAKSWHYRFRNIDAQKFGMPTIKGILNETNTDEQDEEIKATIEKWQENLALYIPAEFKPDGTVIPQADVSFLERASQGGEIFTKTIDSLNTAMRRKLGVPDMAGFTDVKHGSRALGETHLKEIILSAEYDQNRLADLADYQIIPQLVRYNFGDVPLPKLGFHGLKDPKILAEVVKLWAESGAVDPKEPFVRQYLQTPPAPVEEETEDEDEMPTPPAPTDNDTDNELPRPEEDEDEPKNPPGQPAPDQGEKMKLEDRFDFKLAGEWFDSVEEEMQPVIRQALQQTGASYMNRALRMGVLENKDWETLNKIQPKGKWRGQLRKAIEAILLRMWWHGRALANDEIGKAKKRGVAVIQAQMTEYPPIPEPMWGETARFLDKRWVEKWIKRNGLTITAADREATRWLHNYAFHMSGVKSQEMVAHIGTLIYTNAPTMMPKELVALVEREVGKVADARSWLIVRNNASHAFNNARLATFEQVSDMIKSYDYSAILDGNETDFCNEQDGRTITTDNPMFARINPPNHHGCRSVLIPRWKGEDDNPKKWRQSLVPAINFGG